MKKFFLFLILCCFSFSAWSQDTAKGEEIFTMKCSACHKVDKRLIGPPLKGVAAKYDNDYSYITSFVHNSQELIKSGDPRAVAIFDEYNQQVMTNFPEISEEEVQDIMAYADSFEEKSASGIVLRPLPPKKVSSARPMYFSDNILMWIFYFSIVAVVVASLMVATRLSDRFSS